MEMGVSNGTSAMPRGSRLPNGREVVLLALGLREVPADLEAVAGGAADHLAGQEVLMDRSDG